MSVQYRVIPFLGKMKGSQSAAEVGSQLQAALNQHAAEGWAFAELGSVNIEVQPGCLAGLFGAKADYMRFDMLVFQRELDGSQLSTSGSTVQSAPPITTQSPTALTNLDAAKAMAKKLSTLGFSASEIAAQLEDRGYSKEDAEAISKSFKK